MWADQVTAARELSRAVHGAREGRIPSELVEAMHEAREAQRWVTLMERAHRLVPMAMEDLETEQ